jgi:hypothetical protein
VIQISLAALIPIFVNANSDYAGPDGAWESFYSVFYIYGSPAGFATITDPVHFNVYSKPVGLVYL